MEKGLRDVADEGGVRGLGLGCRDCVGGSFVGGVMGEIEGMAVGCEDFAVTEVGKEGEGARGEPVEAGFGVGVGVGEEGSEGDVGDGVGVTGASVGEAGSPSAVLGDFSIASASGFIEGVAEGFVVGEGFANFEVGCIVWGFEVGEDVWVYEGWGWESGGECGWGFEGRHDGVPLGVRLG